MRAPKRSGAKPPLADPAPRVGAGPSPDELRTDALARLHIELTDLQADAVRHVVDGRDTLLVSPTGSGKSAVYQLAGSLLRGTTVVDSP